METFAFYSYKGGVGRSLLVANTARFLGMLGKRVLALDLDFEAPGLHYKLKVGGPSDPAEPAMSGGAVPYLVATARTAKNPPPLREHLVELALPEGSGGWLGLMPAGPAPRREYWAALKQLRERLHFDDPSGKGLAPLLDLHGRIQDELKPDYLLIDARTGVTELGGLATTALADCVVCLLVANQESVDGTLAIVEALKGSARLPGRGLPRIVPVIARATGDTAKEGRTAEGIRRLVEFGEGPDAGGKGKREAFALPHDSLLGATDRVVGGEQKASTFSPLHEAYLELFQHLFPQARKRAEEVLRRLKGVADLREDLTQRRRRRFSSQGGFDPWPESAIEEGVVLVCDDSKNSRYADLVCRGARGEPLMVAEYTAEEQESDALHCWKQHRSVRCVVLVHRSQYGYARKTYYRARGWDDFQPSDRYELPFPREFEVFSDPGHPSVGGMLDALHRGHAELVPQVVAEWQECMAALGMGMHRPGPSWRPVEARRILDGLAATENVEVGVRILQHAARVSSRGPDSDHFDDRHGGSGLGALTEGELFAPLFWRLPPETAIKYLDSPDSPWWTPCLAGHRLLAEEMMGLRYDPVKGALRQAQSFAAQVLHDEGEEDHEDDRALHRIHRQLHDSRTCLCEEPPPILLWDRALREDRYWSGDPEQIGDKAREKAKVLMGAASQLRAWLRGRIARGALNTGNLLARSDPSSGRIDLYTGILNALAPSLGLHPRYLKSVVFVQLSALAMGHQARDLDGQPGFGFAVASPAGPFDKESPVHIALSQYFTFRLIERLGDANLMGAFEKLSDNQPEPYRTWRKMRHIPIEQMRTALLRARLSEAAIELPGGEPMG